MRSRDVAAFADRRLQRRAVVWPRHWDGGRAGHAAPMAAHGWRGETSYGRPAREKLPAAFPRRVRHTIRRSLSIRDGLSPPFQDLLYANLPKLQELRGDLPAPADRLCFPSCQVGALWGRSHFAVLLGRPPTVCAFRRLGGRMGVDCRGARFQRARRCGNVCHGIQAR